MIQYISLLIPLVLVFISGCCVSPQQDTASVDQIVLLDVQGLWGGVDLWIDSAGKAFCRVAKPPEEGQRGLQETRYTFTVPNGQLIELCRLFSEHQFCAFHIEDRYGIPDEARPTIYIRKGEQTCGAAKWSDDTHSDFDPIYKLLLQISEKGTQGTQIGSGAYDWNWKPPGFPENQMIYNMTDHKVKKKNSSTQ